METIKPVIKLDLDIDDIKPATYTIKVEPILDEKPPPLDDVKPSTSAEPFLESAVTNGILPKLNLLRRFSLETDTEIKEEVVSDDDIPLSELPKFESETFFGYSQNSDSEESDDNTFRSDLVECQLSPLPAVDDDVSNHLSSDISNDKPKKKKKKKDKKSKKDKKEKREKRERKEKSLREKKEPKVRGPKPAKEKSECKLCLSQFSGLKDFRRHTRSHFDSLTCPVCLAKFDNVPDLRDHVDAHITNYTCKKCGQAFIRNSNLSRHEEICNPEEQPLLCPHCGKHFPLRRQLRQHIVLHESERPFKCSNCPKSFRINSRLADHEKTHIGVKPYKCSLCAKPFHSASDMKKHEKRHENPNFRPNYVDKDRNRITKCSICNEEVINIRRHVVEHYQAYGYSCGVCGKALKSYKALISHVKIHEGNPWECDICLRRFNRKNNMLMHRERHSMEGYRAKIKQKDLANQMFNSQIATQLGGSLTAHLTNHLATCIQNQVTGPSNGQNPPSVIAPIVSHQIAKLI